MELREPALNRGVEYFVEPPASCTSCGSPAGWRITGVAPDEDGMRIHLECVDCGAATVQERDLTRKA
jgi:hypothetical protein